MTSAENSEYAGNASSGGHEKSDGRKAACMKQEDNTTCVDVADTDMQHQGLETGDLQTECQSKRYSNPKMTRECGPFCKFIDRASNYIARFGRKLRDDDDDGCAGSGHRRTDSSHAQGEEMPWTWAYIKRGSYEESGPNPTLLQTAADTVHLNLQRCAHDIFRFIRSHTPAATDGVVRLSDFHLSSSNGYREETCCKLALRAFLCSAFFSEANWGWGFRPAVFLRPLQLKRELFETYTRCKSEDMLYLTIIKEKLPTMFASHTAAAPGDSRAAYSSSGDNTDVRDFLQFFHSKIQSPLFSEFKIYQNTPMTQSLLFSDEAFKQSIVRLATSVWLIHKLTFSFEPTAEIFHVPQGSAFDENYMVDGAETGSSDDTDSTSIAAKRGGNVALMCAPGFVVRNTIIKSRVICLMGDDSSAVSRSRSSSEVAD